MSLTVELHVNGAMAHADEVSSIGTVDAAIQDLRNDIEDGVFDVDGHIEILVIRHNDDQCECDDLEVFEDVCQIISSHMISE